MLPHASKSSLCLPVIQKLWIGRRKVREKEENEKNNKWKHLPDDVMELIMKRLCLQDYLALRKICSPWRSIITNAIANKHCCPLSELPLVLLDSEGLSLFSLRTEREFFPKRSLFDRTKMTYHGSLEGWMILSFDHNKSKGSLSFSFFNPVTNHKVSVPSPFYFPSNSQIQAKDFFIGKMVASSTPNSSCYKSDCYLAGLLYDRCHIAFYMLFDDSNSWYVIESDSGVHFEDLEIMGSKLYVMTDESLNSILVYDLKNFIDGSAKPKVLTMLPQKPTQYLSRTIHNQSHISGLTYSFLAKHQSSEQLFLTFLICSAVYKHEHVNPSTNIVTKFVFTPEITAVQVFKLDMKKEPIAWIKCESLDDNVVFVSCDTSMVMSRASLNSPQESIRENSVYFALSFDCVTDPWEDTRLGIMNLTDSSIKYFSIEKSSHSAGTYASWFVPSI